MRKCNKIYRMPLGSPTKKIVRICGRCVIHNGRKTREWLNKQEEELK
jgi:hypothetical protein